MSNDDQDDIILEVEGDSATLVELNLMQDTDICESLQNAQDNLRACFDAIHLIHAFDCRIHAHMQVLCFYSRVIHYLKLQENGLLKGPFLKYFDIETKL